MSTVTTVPAIGAVNALAEVAGALATVGVMPKAEVPPISTEPNVGRGSSSTSTSTSKTDPSTVTLSFT